MSSFYLDAERTTITALTTLLFASHTQPQHASVAPQLFPPGAEEAHRHGSHANYQTQPLATCNIKMFDYGAFFKMKINGMAFDGFDISKNYIDSASDVQFAAGGTKIGMVAGETADLDLGQGQTGDASNSYVFTSTYSTANAYAAGSAAYLKTLYMGRVSEDIFTDSQYTQLFNNEQGVGNKVDDAIAKTSKAFNDLAETGGFIDAKNTAAVDTTTFPVGASNDSFSRAQLMFDLFMEDDNLHDKLQTRLDAIAKAVQDGKTNAIDISVAKYIEDDSGNKIGEYGADAAANALRDVIVYLPLAANDTIKLNSYFNVDDSGANGVVVIQDAGVGGNPGSARYHKNYFVECIVTCTDPE